MTIDMTPEALLALVAETTPGPWTLDHHGVDDCLADVWTEPGEDEERICENATAEDASLIVLAPTLAAEVIALREREARLVEALRATAEQALRVEIPDGYGDEFDADEFNMGYDAAIKVARTALAEIEKEAGDAP